MQLVKYTRAAISVEPLLPNRKQIRTIRVGLKASEERNKFVRNNRGGGGGGGGGELQLGEELPLADVFSRCQRSIHRESGARKSGFPRELIATEKFGARLFADFPGVLTSRETRGPC